MIVFFVNLGLGAGLSAVMFGGGVLVARRFRMLDAWAEKLSRPELTRRAVAAPAAAGAAAGR